MGDDDEAGVGPLPHLVEHAAEAVDVGVVQRGVDLVENADRGRIGEEDGEDQGRRRQGLFAARHQAHDCQPLAGRAGVDLQPGLERIVALDEFQLGLAAAEQGLEQAFEIVVDDVESRHQPLAALGVEFVDAVAQLGDGGRQVAALDLHGIEPVAVFDRLVLGAQVDGAEGLALALQTVQQALGAGGVGRAGDGVVGQLLAQLLGRHLGGLAQVGLGLGQPFDGPFGARGQPGPGLARL